MSLDHQGAAPVVVVVNGSEPAPRWRQLLHRATRGHLGALTREFAVLYEGEGTEFTWANRLR